MEERLGAGRHEGPEPIANSTAHPADPPSPASGKGPAKERGIASPLGLTTLALALGLALEVLFFGHRLGISFPIWTALSIAALLGASRLEAIRPARSSLGLVVPIVLFAGMVARRVEPMTVSLSIIATLALFGLWIRTFRSGDLLAFGWTDFILTLIVVPLESWVRPWGPLAAAQRQALQGRRTRAQALSLLRGVILALPVLLVFTALLSAADLIFAQRVGEALRWIDLDRVTEYLGRASVVILGGLFSFGAMVIALRGRERRAGEGKELLPPFLGLTEALVVLTTVDLVFLFFVVIQIMYLFGGDTNITLTGYTYAEYARRGFGELAAVSILSLGLILSLATVTVRQTRRQTVSLNALGALLVLQVGVILASALTRLLLYENAYGFTRLRTYTHVAIDWMALLFLVFLVALLRGRLKRFALAAAAIALGYTASLGLLNVDKFIVRQNAARLTKTGDIDLAYLLSLSEDAVPSLMDLLDARPELASDLAPQLACWRSQLQRRDRYWAALNLARESAWRALGRLGFDAVGSPVWRTAGGQWRTLMDGKGEPCLHQPRLRGPG